MVVKLGHPKGAVFYRDLERAYDIAARASGVWIEGKDGRRWLDACGGALTVSVGHGRERVVRAAARQMERVGYVHGGQFTTDSMEEAAALLVASLPPGYRDASVYLTPGGAEAVETAIKLARAHAVAAGRPERWRVVSQRPGYHGNTLGALAVSGRDALRAPYEAMLADMPLVPAPWCPRCPLDLAWPDCGVACADELANGIDETVAAVLVEPVLGASAGGYAPPEDYLRRVARAAKERGVLLVADEVLTGCGRTGRFLACEHSGVEPDVLALGKGLTSGYVPGGAVVAKPGVVEAAAPDFRHGFTFSHHPVVAAVVREVLTIIRDERLVERAAALEEDLRRALAPSGDWWARGLLAGTAGVPARRFADRAFERGLLVYPVAPDLALVAPPLTITREEIAEIGRRLA